MNIKLNLLFLGGMTKSMKLILCLAMLLYLLTTSLRTPHLKYSKYWDINKKTFSPSKIPPECTSCESIVITSEAQD